MEPLTLDSELVTRGASLGRSGLCLGVGGLAGTFRSNSASLSRRSASVR